MDPTAADKARKEGREDAAPLLQKVEEMTYHVRTIRRFILSGLLGSNTEADAAPHQTPVEKLGVS